MHYYLIDTKENKNIFEFTRDKETGNIVKNKKAATNKSVSLEEVFRLESTISTSIEQCIYFCEKFQIDFQVATLKARRKSEEEVLKVQAEMKESIKEDVKEMDENLGIYIQVVEILENKHGYKSNRLDRLLLGYSQTILKIVDFIDDKDTRRNEILSKMMVQPTVLELGYM